MPIPAWTLRISLHTCFEGCLLSETADIGINTASTCEKSICFVPELVAGSLCQFDPGSASDPFTARGSQLQYVSSLTQRFLHAYATPSCLPTHFAVTLSMYTLIPTLFLPSFAEECSFGNWSLDPYH